MTRIKNFLKTVTCRDLSDQVAEAKRLNEEAKTRLSAAPKDKLKEAIQKQRDSLVPVTTALVVAASALVGCSTSRPEAPQPATAPVNQAGSPVSVTINVRASDSKTDVSKGQDASGAVSTKGGTQEASATTDVKPTTNVSGVPK